MRTKIRYVVDSKGVGTSTFENEVNEIINEIVSDGFKVLNVHPASSSSVLAVLIVYQK